MNVYPFASILINGRDVPVHDIISGSAIPRDDFEKDTFLFISDWLGEKTDFLLHTSGSTGIPKDVVISRAQMTASAEMTAKALELKEGYHALLCLSPAYIAGKMMLVRCFVTGMKIIAVTPSGNPLVNIGVDQKIDFAALVPLQVHNILHSFQATLLDRITTVIIGGGSLDDESCEMLQPFAARVYATYGMTETVSHIALRPLNGTNKSDEFTVLPGIQIEQDDRGCLTIDWNILPSTVVTNDIVELAGKKTFRWLGRWDNVINTGGLKVIPETLESVIGKIFRTLKIDHHFFITSATDKKLGNKIQLIIEGDVPTVMLENLKSSLDHSLKKHEVPREIIHIKRFKFTDTGKINRKSTLNLT